MNITGAQTMHTPPHSTHHTHLVASSVHSETHILVQIHLDQNKIKLQPHSTHHILLLSTLSLRTKECTLNTIIKITHTHTRASLCRDTREWRHYGSSNCNRYQLNQTIESNTTDQLLILHNGKKKQ